eukprot:873305-Rhodomonas_salina.2
MRAWGAAVDFTLWHVLSGQLVTGAALSEHGLDGVPVLPPREQGAREGRGQEELSLSPRTCWHCSARGAQRREEKGEGRREMGRKERREED